MFDVPVVRTGMPSAVTDVPRISNSFASGVAVPLFVTNVVGMSGWFCTTSISPACEIKHLRF